MEILRRRIQNKMGSTEVLPKVTIVTPTLNASAVLEAELESVRSQDYPKELVEILIADGGSTDATLDIAKKYSAVVVPNSLKTAEAGKAVGVRNATGDFVVLLDSDNILPDSKWLKRMIMPLLKHPDVPGSEPWAYTWRAQDGFIARYCALIGMNDPLVHFLGNYDRMNLLTGTWTEVPHTEDDFGDYIIAHFDSHGLPTIGANGTVFRTDFLRKHLKGDYLFDIDLLASVLSEKGSLDFIKVKVGVVHTYCESNIRKFMSKQRRRILDYRHHASVGDRSYDWNSSFLSLGLLKFVLYSLTVVPLVAQSIRGYLKKPDVAWFFHPLACEITLWVYGTGFISSIFKHGEMSRDNWKQ